MWLFKASELLSLSNWTNGWEMSVWMFFFSVISLIYNSSVCQSFIYTLHLSILFFVLMNIEVQKWNCLKSEIDQFDLNSIIGIKKKEFSIMLYIILFQYIALTRVLLTILNYKRKWFLRKVELKYPTAVWR